MGIDAIRSPKTAVLFMTLVASLLLVSCENPTVLTLSQKALSFADGGGTQTVVLTANKAWTASSRQSWLHVSPSSGEGNSSVSISCEDNASYDVRTGDITFVSGELTQTLSVSQAEKPGLLVSQAAYQLSSEAQTLSLEVSSNVPYVVEVDGSGGSWIRQDATKSLTPKTLCFAISSNASYEGREGTITVRQTQGSLSASVLVKQDPSYVILVDKTFFELSYEAHAVDIKVKSNVDYEVEIAASCSDWISRAGTKGLTESTVSLVVAENEQAEREGKVVLKSGNVRETVTIRQASGIVPFEDATFKAYCVRNFDQNGDGEISMAEAAAVTRIDVHSQNIASLAGIEYFHRLHALLCYNNILTSLDIRNNTALTCLDCGSNLLTRLDVSKNPALDSLFCGYNRLTMLNASKNPALKWLDCHSNQMTSLDLSRNAVLTHMDCSHNQLTLLDVSKNVGLKELYCFSNPRLTEIWLHAGQTIADFQFDKEVVTLCYVE